MRKKIIVMVIIGLLVGWTIGGADFVFAQTATSTPTPTETILATTPTISPTSSSPTATASAGPTKITSLPKTGFMQYSIVFVAVSVGVILFSLIF